MPGPPLRGMSSPAATSITKICTSASAGREDRGQVVAAALDEDDVQRPGRGLELLDRLEVGGDVVADRGVRAAAGLDRGDALGGQHAGGAQELGVLGRVDVVGDDAEARLVRKRAAQRGDQAALAGADGAADADPECSFNWQRDALSFEVDGGESSSATAAGEGNGPRSAATRAALMVSSGASSASQRAVTAGSSGSSFSAAEATVAASS